MGRKKHICFFLVLLLLFLVTGCEYLSKLTEKKPQEPKNTEPEVKITKGGTVRVSLMEPGSLDPAFANESEAFQVVKEIFDGLVDYDPDNFEIKPAIAKSWKVNEDATVFTFTLKKGVLFHNGRECVARDFIYSWSRVANKETVSTLAYHLSPIIGFEECQSGTSTVLKGLEAPDDYTLIVRLKYPYADFIQTLGHTVFSVVPREDVKEHEDEFGENPSGTGPFTFKEWSRDTRITLEGFDKYHGEGPYIDTLEFMIFADLDAAMLEFRNGTLDISVIPPGQIKEIEKDEELKDLVIIKPLMGVYFYGIVFNKSPYKEVRELRQALNYLIDREKIIETILEGIGTPATGFVPEGVHGYQKDMMDYKYDPEQAKGLLIKAGYPEGEDLPKLVLGYAKGASHDEIAQIFQDSAEEVGIRIELRSYEWIELIRKAVSGEIDLYSMGWVADYPMMGSFLFPNFHSQSSDNFGGFKDKEIDKALEEARTIQDDTERISKHREIERQVLEDAATIPIYFSRTRRIIQPDLRGVKVTPADEIPYELVWIEKELM